MEDDIPPVLDEIDDAPSEEIIDAPPPIGDVAPPADVSHDSFDDEEEKVRIKKVVEGAPKWVVTFGDLMSLLLTFFVLLLSFSSMDPIRFKIVRGSLDKAMGIQRKVRGTTTPQAVNLIGKAFNRRDFKKKIESILKIALRDTFPPGQEPGKVEKVQDIRGEVVRFVAYDVFLPGTEEPGPQAKLIYRAMADTLVRSGGRMEVRGLASEAFSKDSRQRGQKIDQGVTRIAVAGRRAVLACDGVRRSRPKDIQRRTVLPAVSPGTSKLPPPGVVNVTQFVFLAPDAAPGKRKAP